MKYRRNGWKHRFLLGMFVLGGCLLAPSVSAQDKGNFRVESPSVNAEAIEFNYYAPYPGMTKVLMYDGQGNLIWRGQYIDPEGNNKLRLRSTYLKSGAPYVFQFYYKLDNVKIEIVAP